MRPKAKCKNGSQQNYYFSEVSINNELNNEPAKRGCNSVTTPFFMIRHAVAVSFIFNEMFLWGEVTN